MSSYICYKCKKFKHCTKDLTYNCNDFEQLILDQNINIDVIGLIDSYVNQDTWRVNENANMTFSFANLMLNVAGKAFKTYWLYKVYKDIPAIIEMYESGCLHIHDLGLLTPYCAGWSLSSLLDKGITTVVPNPRHSKENEIVVELDDGFEYAIDKNCLLKVKRNNEIIEITACELIPDDEIISVLKESSNEGQIS